MKFAIVSGSHRPDSQSGKIARYVSEQLVSQDAGHSTYVLELGKNPLPLWEEGVWRSDPKMTEPWQPISKEVSACDAAVVIAAEWGGMVPPALKNFFLFAADGCLYHKPGLLIGVSGSKNGAYPIAEMRMSSYKNVHLHYIPEHVIVRQAGEMLNGPEAQSPDDAYTRKRLDYGLRVLVEYAKASKLVRESGVLNRKDFPFGM